MPVQLSRAFLSFFVQSKPSFSMALSPAHSTPKARLRGVVFDMDGTLTVPVIDFAAMYQAVLGDDEYRRIKSENPSGIDILHLIEDWDPEKQRIAYETIADYESQGLDRLQIMPGAAELCGFLDSKKLRRGLITRNVKMAVDIFKKRFGGVQPDPAYKPDPAPLLHICSAWGVQPNEVIMVGDSLKDDVACGKRAGAFTCLLDQKRKCDSPVYADVEFKPDHKVIPLLKFPRFWKQILSWYHDTNLPSPVDWKTLNFTQVIFSFDWITPSDLAWLMQSIMSRVFFYAFIHLGH